MEQGTTLRIDGTARLDLHLRVPSWARAGFTVTVNGVAHPAASVPGTYLTISRSWRGGGTVRISLPFPLRAERALDQPTVRTLMCGPIHLVARDPRRTFLEFGLHGRAALSGDLIGNLAPVTGTPLHFTFGGVEWAVLRGRRRPVPLVLPPGRARAR